MADLKIICDGKDITAYAGNLSWQNTLDELATSLSFDVAKTDTKYLNFYAPKDGSIISLYTGTEIYRGIVISVDDGSETSNKYTSCDFGWYLNKSSETYQFNKMSAKKAITKICEDYGIPIDTIPNLTTEITQLYLDKVLSEIIKDILTLCGGGFNLDVTPKGVRIYKIGSVKASPTFRISENTRKLSSIEMRGNVSHSISIEEMKNSVKVVTEKDSVFALKAEKKDSASIKKYGLLQTVIKIDPEKEDANTVANEKLKELNKKTESFSFEIIESPDSYTRAGAVITVDGADFVITGSTHSITKGIHKVKLDLRRWSA